MAVSLSRKTLVVVALATTAVVGCSRFIQRDEFDTTIGGLNAAIGELRVVDANVVGQFEAALESAVGDAEVKDFTRAGFLALLADDDEQVLLRGDVEVVGTEAGDGDGDAIGILAAALDVERRVVVAAARSARGILEQVEQVIEAHRGTAIGGKIKTVHGETNPLLSNLNMARPDIGASIRR